MPHSVAYSDQHRRRQDHNDRGEGSDGTNYPSQASNASPHGSSDGSRRRRASPVDQALDARKDPEPSGRVGGHRHDEGLELRRREKPSDASNSASGSSSGGGGHKRAAIVQSNGLQFDMSEPWQRSLLRELERKSKEEQSTGSPATSRRSGHQAPTHRHGRMMVGHTESRDFAIDVCDSATMSLMTDASSFAAPPPHHPQLVHRGRAYRDEDVPLADDEDSYTDYDSYAPPQPTPQAKTHKGAPAMAGQRSPRSVRDEMHGQADDDTTWLEMERSELEGTEYDDPSLRYDDATVVTYGTSEGQQEACYCLGYNVMDMILPPNGSRKSRRSGGGGFRSHRPSHGPSTRRLEKVHEEWEEPEASTGCGVGCGRPDSPPSRLHQRPATPESRTGQESALRGRSAIKQSSSRDPDGVYLDPYSSNF